MWSPNSGVVRIIFQFNLLLAYWLRDAPTGFYIQEFYILPHCMCAFCIYLRTNSDFCLTQHQMIGFYNRDEVFTARY